MASKGWAAKLKEEKAQLEAELKLVKQDLTNKDGHISKTTSIVLAIGAFLSGALLVWIF